jgi:hypothetical protein
MRKIRSLVLGTVSATAAATLFGASPANAAIVLCYYNGPGTPACPQTNANVNVDTVTSNTVTGWLNDDHNATLGFTSTGETLVGDGSGQATVSALDGLLNTNVTFALDFGSFNTITWNLEPLSGNHPDTEASSVTIWYTPADGGSPTSYTISGNGQNFRGLYGDAGEQITSITWGGYAAGTGIDSIRQVRLGIGGPGAVPEPATWAMLLFGFGAIGATLRTKKSGSRQRLRVA